MRKLELHYVEEVLVLCATAQDGGAMKGGRKFAPLFEVRSIDAWSDGYGGLEWNESFKLFEFRSDSLDVKRAFTNRLRTHLRKNGGDLGRGWYYVTGDWKMLEICRRCDRCPYFACLRTTPS